MARIRRELRVAIIGAGPGGLCLGIRLKGVGLDLFEIFEKAGGRRRHLVLQLLSGLRLRRPRASVLVRAR